MATEMIEGQFIATMDDPDDPDMFERNRIHTTAGAQEYGFKGAFVGGVTLYAWCIPTVIDALGGEWLDRGWVNIRFRRPTYPGAHIRVRVTPGDDGTAGDDRAARAFAALQDDGEASIVGEVGLGTAPWLGDLTVTPFAPPLPDGGPRPFLTLADAPVGQRLNSYRYGPHTPAAETSGASLAEIIDLETPAGAVLHPAVPARQMIALLMRSYDYGHPAIHVSSHIQHLARIPAGEDVVACGTFVDAYERNGHHVAVLDADLYSLAGEPLARLRHTNIFKVRRAGA
ncbi:MAG TPA: hypothetical protein VIZ00_06820 [Streptosporangiaceae bacterium]